MTCTVLLHGHPTVGPAGKSKVTGLRPAGEAGPLFRLSPHCFRPPILPEPSAWPRSLLRYMIRRPDGAVLQLVTERVTALAATNNIPCSS